MGAEHIIRLLQSLPLIRETDNYMGAVWAGPLIPFAATQQGYTICKMTCLQGVAKCQARCTQQADIMHQHQWISVPFLRRAHFQHVPIRCNLHSRDLEKFGHTLQTDLAIRSEWPNEWVNTSLASSSTLLIATTKQHIYSVLSLSFVIQHSSIPHQFSYATYRICLLEGCLKKQKK